MVNHVSMTEQVQRNNEGGKELSPADAHAGSKFCDAVKNTIIRELEKGCSMNAALAVACLSTTAFNHWKVKGSVPPGELGHKPDYWEFFEKVNQAQGKLESAIVANWAEEAKTDWKAGEAFLSKRFHQDWGPRNKTELSGPDGAPLEFTIVMGDDLSKKEDE